MWTKGPTLAQFDPELNNAIRAERSRQEAHIELIASENYASPAVMEAQGSVLTNKYAEGYPGKRYYPGGCEHVDVAENLALERIKQLFDCDFAQRPAAFRRPGQCPPSFAALLQPGDTITGHEPGPRRTPDPRPPRQLLRQELQSGGLRPRPRNRPDQLRRNGAAGPRAQAENAHRRLLRLFPHQGLGPHARHRRQDRRLVLGRYGPHRRPGRRRGLSQPPAACPRRHQHHPQDPARPQRRASVWPRDSRKTSPRNSTPPYSPASRAAP